jgi:hypothetical protein
VRIIRFLAAVVAVFLVFKAYDVLVHGILLDDAYQAVASIWRPDIESRFWLLHVNSALVSVLFVALYHRPSGARGLVPGLALGVLFWLLVTVVGVISQYVAYPLPVEIALLWILYGAVTFLVSGAMVSVICESRAGGSDPHGA